MISSYLYLSEIIALIRYFQTPPLQKVLKFYVKIELLNFYQNVNAHNLKSNNCRQSKIYAVIKRAICKNLCYDNYSN